MFNFLVLHSGKSAPFCATCQDNPKRKCKECSCQVCGGKDEPDRQLMCDECDMAYHLRCLNPPLEAIPDIDEWFVSLLQSDFASVQKTEVCDFGSFESV